MRREELRKQYIDQGLIDDPNAKKSLSDSKPIVGTCESMCPDFEAEEREYQKSLDKLEMIPGTRKVDKPKAVKTYHRSAAGNDQPLPEDIRTPEALERTMDYLINSVLEGDTTMLTVHQFIRDRTRSIRQDFSIQNIRDLRAIRVYERIARYHILSTHILCEESFFSEAQEMEQLRKTLQSLIEMYDEYRANHNPKEPVTECECEIRAYHILAHIYNMDSRRIAERLPDKLFLSFAVQKAIKIAGYAQSINSQNKRSEPPNLELSQNDYVNFFREIKKPDTPYLFACLSECYFVNVRRSALITINTSVAYLPGREYSTLKLTRILGFDSVAECVEFCSVYGLVCNNSIVAIGKKINKANYIRDPETKPSHTRNMTIVEPKRRNFFLKDIVNGATPDIKSLSTQNNPILIDVLSSPSQQNPKPASALNPSIRDTSSSSALPPSDDPKQQTSSKPFSFNLFNQNNPSAFSFNPAQTTSAFSQTKAEPEPLKLDIKPKINTVPGKNIFGSSTPAFSQNTVNTNTEPTGFPGNQGLFSVKPPIPKNEIGFTSDSKYLKDANSSKDIKEIPKTQPAEPISNLGFASTFAPGPPVLKNFSFMNSEKDKSTGSVDKPADKGFSFSFDSNSIQTNNSENNKTAGSTAILPPIKFGAIPESMNSTVATNIFQFNQKDKEKPTSKPFFGDNKSKSSEPETGLSSGNGANAKFVEEQKNIEIPHSAEPAPPKEAVKKEVVWGPVEEPFSYSYSMWTIYHSLLEDLIGEIASDELLKAKEQKNTTSDAQKASKSASQALHYVPAGSAGLDIQSNAFYESSTKSNAFRKWADKFKQAIANRQYIQRQRVSIAQILSGRSELESDDATQSKKRFLLPPDLDIYNDFKFGSYFPSTFGFKNRLKKRQKATLDQESDEYLLGISDQSSSLLGQSMASILHSNLFIGNQDSDDQNKVLSSYSTFKINIALWSSDQQRPVLDWFLFQLHENMNGFNKLNRFSGVASFSVKNLQLNFFEGSFFMENNETLGTSPDAHIVFFHSPTAKDDINYWGEFNALMESVIECSRFPSDFTFEGLDLQQPPLCQIYIWPSWITASSDQTSLQNLYNRFSLQSKISNRFISYTNVYRFNSKKPLVPQITGSIDWMLSVLTAKVFSESVPVDDALTTMENLMERALYDVSNFYGPNKKENIHLRVNLAHINLLNCVSSIGNVLFSSCSKLIEFLLPDISLRENIPDLKAVLIEGHSLSVRELLRKYTIECCGLKILYPEVDSRLNSEDSEPSNSTVQVPNRFYSVVKYRNRKIADDLLDVIGLKKYIDYKAFELALNGAVNEISRLFKNWSPILENHKKSQDSVLFSKTNMLPTPKKKRLSIEDREDKISAEKESDQKSRFLIADNSHDGSAGTCGEQGKLTATM
ncbi:hypothetical protein BB560_001398 [Smittium megazygosporum]|uniref:SAC3/GANP/THP3 conserved domain-containing protein n=1 Tax=Smittium megazygosporum TaxID=133381 RepID=A0A2T9ZHQ7_9FUNG|nr:hypothetical protein BB560_001398 [Smittium megazygosporum]